MPNTGNSSLLSENPGRFQDRAVLGAGAAFLGLQSYCFLSASSLPLLAIWAGVLSCAGVFVFKSRTFVFLAFLINATSLFTSAGTYVTLALAPITIVLVLDGFLHGKSLKFPFSGSYLVIWASMVVSILYAVMICGFDVLSAKLSVRVVLYFLAFYATYFALSKDNFRGYVHVFMVSSVFYLVGVYVMMQQLSYWVPHRLSVNHLVQPNQISMYLELFYPVAFFSLIGSRGTMEKLGWAGLTFIYLVNILLTYSKAGLITVVICLGYYFFRKINVRKILVVCLLAAALSPLFYKGYHDRIALNSIDSFLSAMTRIELYKTALKVLKDNYYIPGIGLDQFSSVKFDYDFARFLDPMAVMSSHNLYLDFWMGLGLPALLAFLFILVRTIIDLLRLPAGRMDGLKHGFALSIIAYMVHGLFDNNLPESCYTISLFVILGFSRFLIERQGELERQAGTGSAVSP